ncbi:Uncharacterised protein [Leclercia adecarboxylata]|uniref:Uncharacterized protein n=1 Tax=Leclercia adecarboxylata TaxID=83655 RepID=A0A4V6JMB3_9ENTR|nr:Uncharacterised protein [Leclercia adecarboxylata]
MQKFFYIRIIACFFVYFLSGHHTMVSFRNIVITFAIYITSYTTFWCSKSVTTRNHIIFYLIYLLRVSQSYLHTFIPVDAPP